MRFSYVRTWLFVGAMAVGACSDSHDAREGDEPEEETDPAATDDEQGESKADARASGSSNDAGSDSPPEATPGPGAPPGGPAGTDAGVADGGKRDRPMSEAGMPKPMPPDPRHDGGPTPPMPKPPEVKHDGGPPPPVAKPNDPKHDGGPAAKPDGGP